MADAPPAPSSGGFKAVNNGFTSVNRGSHDALKSSTPDPKRFDSPGTGVETPDDQAGLGAAAALKGQMSREASSESKRQLDEEKEEESTNRRSKRLKKGKVAMTLR